MIVLDYFFTAMTLLRQGFAAELPFMTALSFFRVGTGFVV